jgi:hypothetical protein
MNQSAELEEATSFLLLTAFLCGTDNSNQSNNYCTKKDTLLS